ncbi:hypothetical protein [Rhodoferax sp. TS-BS-61-7]|uniref:hypothetical protein n=1 Tax=Rhodoferax sp. TS-BS-61-7 TaxID=2094194 RepID=UPI0011B0B8AF|nr:hypothetical protein [Rhodoferax sp. TS-BS-61-7]
MTHPEVTQEVLDLFRRLARETSRKDNSKSYTQWLDHFCHAYGFTFASAKQYLEDKVWDEKFQGVRVWGSPPSQKNYKQAFPETDRTEVAWPNCLNGSALFSVSESSFRASRSGPVFNLDQAEISYEGEELRVEQDQTLLMGLITISRDKPCGITFEFTLKMLEQEIGYPIPPSRVKKTDKEIERSLWRLANCRLTMPAFGFDGPFLSYVDVSESPQHYKCAFNPSFLCLYYS